LENVIAIITSGIVALVGALLAFITATLAKRGKKELEERKKKAVEQLSMWRNYIAHGLPSELKSDSYRQELVYQWLLNVADSKIQRTPQVTQDQMKAEIENVTRELVDRIDKIEKRIPSEATIDKVASVNDAILATHIETLSESIKRIEDRLLTKWDVAKIVFTIIGALGVITGLILTIIKFLSQGGG
jgi:hypothetical protein